MLILSAQCVISHLCEITHCRVSSQVEPYAANLLAEHGKQIGGQFTIRLSGGCLCYECRCQMMRFFRSLGGGAMFIAPRSLNVCYVRILMK